MQIIESFDKLLPSIFNKIANPFFDFVMIFMTKLGDGGGVWILAIIVMLFFKKYRKLALVAALSLSICFFSGNYFIKPIVGRIRPCNLYPELPMIVPRALDYSFPSMHTASSFSVATIFLIYEKKIGISALVISTLIALSRVYLNLHFTTDILGGAIYGCLIAVVVNFVIKKTNFTHKNY